MSWKLEEAISHYRRMGAPGDQSAVISLLREVQQESGGAIPRALLPRIAEGLQAKEALLTALIRRIPSLKLEDQHTLELCSGPNCSRQTQLAAYAEKLCAGKNITVKYVPCMCLCGKSPNLRWDGTLYHKADEAMLQKLLKNISSAEPTP